MADSTRQQIITALDTRLKAIKVSGGYQTNAGLHVFDWLDRDLADAELDAIVYRDRSNGREVISTRGLTRNTMFVEIEVKTKNAAGTASQVRKLLEDVLKAIGTDETFNGLVKTARPGTDNLDIQQAEKIKGSGDFTLSIEYETGKWAF